MPRTPSSAVAPVADAASLAAYPAEELRGVVRALLDASRDPLLLVDAQGRFVVDANAAAAERLGVPLVELQSGRTLLDCGDVSQTQSGRVYRLDAASGALWVVALDKSPEAPQRPFDATAEPAGVDALTGLADRCVFQRRLAEALVRAATPGGPACAVLFIDLDGFKPINDRLGHLAGDRLLCEVSRAIAGSVRPGDLVARFGGDEFTVLVTGLAHRDDALGVARRIADHLSRFSESNDAAPALTASIGVALSDDGYVTAETMLDAADKAMYAAKRLGKSRFAVASPETTPD